MLNLTLFLNAGLGVLSALGFALGRFALPRQWTARQLWPLSIATFWVFFLNLALAFIFATFYFYRAHYIWCLGILVYLVMPFTLAQVGQTFNDRRWVLPLTSILLVFGSVGFFCLAFASV